MIIGNSKMKESFIIIIEQYRGNPDVIEQVRQLMAETRAHNITIEDVIKGIQNRLQSGYSVGLFDPDIGYDDDFLKGVGYNYVNKYETFDWNWRIFNIDYKFMIYSNFGDLIIDLNIKADQANEHKLPKTIVNVVKSYFQNSNDNINLLSDIIF